MTRCTEFKNDHSSAPRLCQIWCDIQSASPSITVFGLDFGFTVMSALILAAFRFLVECLQVHVFGWPEVAFVTKNAASGLVAVLHSIILVPTLVILFLKGRYNPVESLDDVLIPGWYRETTTALLQFCTGYMIYDGLLNGIWLNYALNPDGLGILALTFTIHHSATIIYMTSTRILQAGHQSAMICMLLGECTNPLYNGYYVIQAALKLECCNGEWVQWLFPVVEFSLALCYFVVRAILGPVVFVHLTYCLWLPRNHRIPTSILAMWTFLIWLVEVGSLPFIVRCYDLVLYYLERVGLMASTELTSPEEF